MKENQTVVDTTGFGQKLLDAKTVDELLNVSQSWARDLVRSARHPDFLANQKAGIREGDEPWWHRRKIEKRRASQEANGQERQTCQPSANKHVPSGLPVQTSVFVLIEEIAAERTRCADEESRKDEYLQAAAGGLGPS